MSFEDQTTAELSCMVKAKAGFAVLTTNKAVDKIKQLPQVTIESGEKITFLAQQSMVGTQLKSILLNSQ